MADLPFLQWSPRDYLGDTGHLSTVEHGAYMLLIWAAWMRPTRSLPDDDERLARITRLSIHDWLDMKDTIMAFWAYDGRTKTYTQKRLLNEAKRAKKMSTSQRAKARTRWEKEKNPDAGASAGHKEGRQSPGNGNQEAGSRKGSVADATAELPLGEPEKTPFDDDYEPAQKPSPERAAIDMKKAVFDAGVDLGMKRSLIGKCCQEYGEGAVLDMLAKAQVEQPADINSWAIEKLKRPRGYTNGAARPARDASCNDLYQALAGDRHDPRND